MNELYITEYNSFLAAYKRGAVNAEAVGEIIVRMAQYFVTANIHFAQMDIAFNVKASEFEQQVDMNTGKPVSSARAKILSDATTESANKIVAETHVKNIDVILQSLKALQKGLTNEFSYMGKT